MSSRKPLPLLLAFLAGAAIGFALANPRGSTVHQGGETSRETTNGKAVARDGLEASAESSSRPRVKDAALPKTDRIAIRPDGSVLVPAELADRIRIRAMDTEGIVDPAELALAGIVGRDAEDLRALIDEAKAFTQERQSRNVQVLRQDDNLTVLRIPGDPSNSGRGEEFQTRVKELLGDRAPLVSQSLSHMVSVTSYWGTADQIVCVEPYKDGMMQYKVLGFMPGRSDNIDMNQLTPAALEESAVSRRGFRSEDVPPQLRHLFK